MLLWFVFPASLPAPTWLHESEKESTEILQPPLAPLEIEESEQVRDKREQSIKTAEERLSRREEILEARKNAEQLLANQKSDLDSAAALAALAETAAQLETIRKIKNRAL